MNFYFCFNNNPFLPVCYDPGATSAPTHSSCTVFYQPLLLNPQLQQVTSLQNLVEVNSLHTEEVSMPRIEIEKRPKRR